MIRQLEQQQQAERQVSPTTLAFEAMHKLIDGGFPIPYGCTVVGTEEGCNYGGGSFGPTRLNGDWHIIAFTEVWLWYDLRWFARLNSKPATPNG